VNEKHQDGVLVRTELAAIAGCECRLTSMAEADSKPRPHLVRSWSRAHTSLSRENFVKRRVQTPECATVQRTKKTTPSLLFFFFPFECFPFLSRLNVWLWPHTSSR
jgi:hypothetical protein